MESDTQQIALGLRQGDVVVLEALVEQYQYRLVRSSCSLSHLPVGQTRDGVVHRWIGLDDCRLGTYVLPNANLDFTFVTAFGEVFFTLWLWIRAERSRSRP
jgi:hypothetical protein